jgi:TRAP-type uncharacterized transport system fused permease subunit
LVGAHAIKIRREIRRFPKIRPPHRFLLYFGMLSLTMPPDCLATYRAAATPVVVARMETQ